MYDRLSKGTKELPPLNTGDFVMIQNQLGKKTSDRTNEVLSYSQILDKGSIR